MTIDRGIQEVVNKKKISMRDAVNNLLKEDEVKRAKVAKLELKNRKSRQVGKVIDPSTKTTKIPQVTVDGKFTSDIESKKTGDFIPTSDYASSYTEKMPQGVAGGTGGEGSNQKSPRLPGVKSMKPSQETKTKEAKGIDSKRTASDDDKIFHIPQAEFASRYTEKMPHGEKNLRASSETGNDPKKPSVQTMKGGPTRKGGKRTPNIGNEQAGAKKIDSQKVPDIGKPSGDIAAPSDAPAWKKHDFKKETHGATNVVESGVMVTLNGKKKAIFDIVHQNVLHRMIESYESHGYDVGFRRVDAGWKKDKKLLSLIRESVNARYNFAPKTSSKLRSMALKRFHSLVGNSYNNLYESRDEFAKTIVNAFKNIEKIAENKYLHNLNIYESICRVKLEEGVADLEIITEATNHQMALRQVRNKIQEEYGFDTKISHICVDGRKYLPSQVSDYKVPVK